MSMSDHIFWKNKELAEETRSANMAIAAFVKVRNSTIQLRSLRLLNLVHLCMSKSENCIHRFIYVV